MRAVLSVLVVATGLVLVLVYVARSHTERNWQEHRGMLEQRSRELYGGERP